MGSVHVLNDNIGINGYDIEFNVRKTKYVIITRTILITIHIGILVGRRTQCCAVYHNRGNRHFHNTHNNDRPRTVSVVVCARTPKLIIIIRMCLRILVGWWYIL